MSTLFFILAFIALIGLVVGLIKPEKVKMTTRKKALAWFGGSFLVLIILMGITAPPVDPAVLQAREAAKIEKQKQKDEAAAAKKADEAKAEQANSQEQPEAQPQEVNTVAQPEKTPEQLLEDSYRSIVKNIGATDMSFREIDITNVGGQDNPESSKMIVVSVTLGDFLSRSSLIRNTGEMTSLIFQKSLESKLPLSSVTVWYYGQTKDKFGNTSDSLVLSYGATRETIDKINWGGFDKTGMCDFLKSFNSLDNTCVELVSIK